MSEVGFRPSLSGGGGSGIAAQGREFFGRRRGGDGRRGHCSFVVGVVFLLLGEDDRRGEEVRSRWFCAIPETCGAVDRRV